MSLHRQSKLPWLFFTSALLLLASLIYFHYRQQVFEVLAAGTQWVLVTCGFEPESDVERGDNLQSDQLRKLYYAARMFNSTPPREILAEDARAEEKYPGVGFGLVHTFNTKPVSLVIGGWLFSIPCTYFSDARDCQASGASLARLKANADDLEPISEATIDAFLAVSSPSVVRITIAGLDGRPLMWWQDASVTEGYRSYMPDGFTGKAGGLICTEADQVSSMMAHCVLHFMHGSDIFVEIKFAKENRNNWAVYQQKAEVLVATFQVKR